MRDGVSMDIPSLASSMGGLSGKTPREQIAQEAATRLFTLFALSDWHVRLAQRRQAKCGRYFELKHWNRSYKKGMLCHDCARIRSLQSALLSTSKARELAERELYRHVARHFKNRIANHPNWHGDPKLRAGIIELLNERIADDESLRTVYRHPLTGKWLSWSKNRRGIEDAAKGKNHAES
jgi:hypothetical protein